MKTFFRQNPLAHVISSQQYEGEECFFYLSFDRSEHICDFCFWSEAPDFTTRHAKWCETLARLGEMLQGQDLLSFATHRFSAESELFYRALAAVDRAIDEYRFGPALKVMGPLAVFSELLCPCQGVMRADVARELEGDVSLGSREIEAKLALALTCGSCQELAADFIAAHRALHGLYPQAGAAPIFIRGLSPAELALEIATYLATLDSDCELLDLRGVNLLLSAPSEELLHSLRQHFKVRFELLVESPL